MAEKRPLSLGFSSKPIKSAADTSTPTESIRHPSEHLSGSEDIDDKKKQYLERNRAAAARSRAKKKKIARTFYIHSLTIKIVLPYSSDKLISLYKTIKRWKCKFRK